MRKAVIPTLERLDKEASEEGASGQDKVQRCIAIKRILDMVEQDFGTLAMVAVVAKVSEEIGHSLGPLHHSILKKLVDNGCKITNVKSIISFKQK